MSNPYPEYKRNTITVPATVVSVARLQKREWAGLTDDELADLWYKQSLDWMEFARAIEAKIKEKNHD